MQEFFKHFFSPKNLFGIIISGGCIYWSFSNFNLDKKHIYKNVSDQSQPHGYETSDLKKLYLTRYELQAKSTGPIVTQEELLQMRSQQ